MTKEHKEFIKKQKNYSLAIRISQIGLLILFLGVWELITILEWVDPFITSSPTRIIKTIGELYKSNMLFNHLATTLWETIVGFTLSTFIGTIVAIALWWCEPLKKVLEPYIVVLNALPKIALGPLIIIWVGAGPSAIITMALLICVVITTISMLQGFLSVDKEKIQLIKSLNGTKIQMLFKLILPANISTFTSVLKINVGLSWVGTIMGEYLVSSEGVGYLLVYGSQIFKLDLVMASTFMLCVMATLMYVFVALLEKLVKRIY